MGSPALTVSMLPESLLRTIAGGEYGFRLSAYTSALDFSLMAFYGWNDIPHLKKV
jgi:hypothetical protein